MDLEMMPTPEQVEDNNSQDLESLNGLVAPQDAPSVEPLDFPDDYVHQLMTGLPPESFDQVPKENDIEDQNAEWDSASDGTPIVSGDPEGKATLIDYEQGDNKYDAEGDCGLDSVNNVLSILGKDVSEDDIVEHAIQNEECLYDSDGNPSENGMTTSEDQIHILNDYGVDAYAYTADSAGGSLDNIADNVENGKGVIMELNAGVLWNEPSAYGEINLSDGTYNANHAVTVTGVERDQASGEVTGLYIADSGRGLESDACRYVSAEELKYCYQNADQAAVVITK